MRRVANAEIVVPRLSTETTDIPGGSYFPSPFPNVFLLAKKNTGKTTVLFNILRKRAGQGDRVIIFASTHLKDPTWKAIKAMLKDKGVRHTAMTEFRNKETKTHHVKNIVTRLRTMDAPQSGRLILVFDDIGDDMRDPYLDQLLKTNRHYRMEIYLSSQYPNDLKPQAIANLDYVLLFRALPTRKLLEVYEKLNLEIPYEHFQAMYEKATKERHSFLWIKRDGEEEFRINFDQKFPAYQRPAEVASSDIPKKRARVKDEDENAQLAKRFKLVTD